MIIDWIYIICLALFLYRGYRKGIIISIVSVIAILAGIAAALKLSGTVLSLLTESHPHLAKWIPLVIYVLIFLIVVWIVRFIGKILQKSVKTIAMGWLNRFLGAILYALVISMVYSVFLWLFTNMGLLSTKEIATSKTYSVLEPLAPRIIAEIGKVIPLFKNGFNDLKQLFEQINQLLVNHVGAH